MNNAFKEYDNSDALGLAGLVRSKQVSPKELCEEAIARIERINPKLNAVVTLNTHRAAILLQPPCPEDPLPAFRS